MTFYQRRQAHNSPSILSHNMSMHMSYNRGTPVEGKTTNLVSFSNKAFQYAAPVLWNSLPVSVKNASTVIKFKSLLKTHLFNVAFNG